MSLTPIRVKVELLKSSAGAVVRHYNDYFHRHAASKLPLVELENYENVNVSFRYDVDPSRNRFSTVTFSVLDNGWMYHFTQSYNYGVPQALDISREGLGANAGDMEEGPDYLEQYTQGLEDAIGHMIDGISFVIAHYTPHGEPNDATAG